MTMHEEVDEPMVKRIAFAPMFKDEDEIDKDTAKAILKSQESAYYSVLRILLDADKTKDILRNGFVLVTHAVLIGSARITYHMRVDREIRNNQHAEMMMVLNQLQTAANFQARELDKLRRVVGPWSGGPV